MSRARHLPRLGWIVASLLAGLFGAFAAAPLAKRPSDGEHDGDLTSATEVSEPAFNKPRPLARQHETVHFTFSSYDRLPLALLGDVAEEALIVSCGTLLLPAGEFRSKHLPVYVCRDRQELIELEKRFGLKYSTHAGGTRFRGGFYEQVPMIAFVDDPDRRLGTIAHEVAHWAISVLVPVTRCPRAIHEGLAGFLQMRTFEARPTEYQAILERLRAKRSRSIRKAWIAGTVGSLPDLLELDHEALFNARRFASAFCLARVLHSSEAGRPGKLRAFLDRLAAAPSDSTPAAILDSMYGLAETERAWKVEVEKMAFGEITWGD